jgi:hypothetical protein
MQRLRIATLLLVLGIAGMACNLYWGNPSPDPHSGPTFPDAHVGNDGGSNHYPDAGFYPDGGWWYPDADVNDGGSSCGGHCPDAAAYLPDACNGGG